MQPKVSVIIVSWNTRQILIDCLRSVYAQTKASMQVLVIDNDSNDGSADAVAEHFPDVDLIRSDTNLGFARANNRGVERATGEYILFLNPDTIILDGAIDTMLQFLETHSNVGVLGPHTYNADGVSTQNTVIFKPTLKRVFHTHVPFWKLIPGWTPAQAGEAAWHKTGPVEVVKGCCMLMPGSLVAELGGMTEKHFMYSEEDDLCRRAAERGYETWYFHEASIIHLGGEATKQNSAVMVKAAIDAYTDVFRYHNPNSSVRIFKALLAFGSMWRWMAWSPLLLVKSKRALARQRMMEHEITVKALAGR
jgi:GT2 family glycosyltransferase